MKKYILAITIFFAAFIFVGEESISASNYYDICDEGKILSKNGTYNKCGGNHIYLYTQEKEHSSSFVSTLRPYEESQILYAGKDSNGIETFYSIGFYYFSVVYDNREIGKSKDNYWSTITADGIVIYSGHFEDNFLIDQSVEKTPILYDEKGTYTIRQYIGAKVVELIKIIVVSEKDYGLHVLEAKYNNKDIYSDSLVGKEGNFNFKISGGEYGFGSKIDVKVNECKFSVLFDVDLFLRNSLFVNCLKYNERNIISLTIYNGFGKAKNFEYKFNLNSNKVTIKLEDTVSALVASSRRIVINAYAGEGKILNKNYNLYYWSSSPNDALTYNEFMKNYTNSGYKGTYTENKGVILRNAEGVYYLYALAKDDDSTVVVRSSEYVLKKSEAINKITRADVIIFSIMAVGAFSPIFIYLCIRGKDME